MAFGSSMVSDVVQPFWAALQRGEFINDAAWEVATCRKCGHALGGGGKRGAPTARAGLAGPLLVVLGAGRGRAGPGAWESMRVIARRLGRSPATVSRELRRNADRHAGYRATTAHARAWERASRPKPAELAANRAPRSSSEPRPPRAPSSARRTHSGARAARSACPPAPPPPPPCSPDADRRS